MPTYESFYRQGIVVGAEQWTETKVDVEESAPTVINQGYGNYHVMGGKTRVRVQNDRHQRFFLMEPDKEVTEVVLKNEKVFAPAGAPISIVYVNKAGSDEGVLSGVVNHATDTWWRLDNDRVLHGGSGILPYLAAALGAMVGLFGGGDAQAQLSAALICGALGFVVVGFLGEFLIGLWHAPKITAVTQAAFQRAQARYEGRPVKEPVSAPVRKPRAPNTPRVRGRIRGMAAKVAGWVAALGGAVVTPHTLQQIFRDPGNGFFTAGLGAMAIGALVIWALNRILIGRGFLPALIGQAAPVVLLALGFAVQITRFPAVMANGVMTIGVSLVVVFLWVMLLTWLCDRAVPAAMPPGQSPNRIGPA